MSAINRNVLPAMTDKPKNLAKSSPASSGLIPVGETSFVAELAVVSNHSDIDHEMQGTPQIINFGVEDVDVIMVDAPAIEVELGVPELDSVMENAPLAELEVKPHCSELHSDDIIIDYS